jgi:hypothetical protein
MEIAAMIVADMVFHDRVIIDPVIADKIVTGSSHVLCGSSVDLRCRPHLLRRFRYSIEPQTQAIERQALHVGLSFDLPYVQKAQSRIFLFCSHTSEEY